MDKEAIHNLLDFLEENKKILLSVLIGLMLFIALVEMVFGYTAGRLQEGRLAFIITFFLRIGVITMLFIVVRTLVNELLLRGDKWGSTGVRGFFAFPIVFVTILLGLLLIVNPIRDFVYLNEPTGETLRMLDFDLQKESEDAMFYNMAGVAADGTKHAFHVNKDTYEEGVARKNMNSATRAEVTFLPHSHFVISIDYVDYGRHIR